MKDNKTNINWFPGHMQKTKRQIRESLPLIDNGPNVVSIINSEALKLSILA